MSAEPSRRRSHSWKMAVKLRISKNSLAFRILKNPWGRAFVVTFLLLGMTATGVFSYYYLQYSRMVDAELKAGVFSNATLLYAAPRQVTAGRGDHRRRHRGVLAAVRLFVLQHQPHGMVSGSSRRRGDQPRTGRLRSGRRGDQDRGRPGDRRSFPCAIIPSAPSICWNRS